MERMQPGKEELAFLMPYEDEALKNELIAQRYNFVLAKTKAKEFFEAIQQGDTKTVSLLLKIAVPIDFRHHKTGETALHVAAACKARDVMRILIAHPDCDYLIRDYKGRLPSELAFLYGNDPTMARLLRIKERQQAARDEKVLTRREPR